MAAYTSLDVSGTPRKSHAGIANIFSFVRSRFLRVPRLASQLLIAVVLILVLVSLVPSHTKQSFLGADFSNYWKWPYSSSAPVSPAFNVSSDGPVRMVVFGTPDIGSPSKAKGETGPGWTEALCAELRCSSHESLVPSVDLPSQALTSNGLYKPALQKLLDPGEDKVNSGVDYRYLNKQYPLSSTADLAHQVGKFLKRPKNANPPKETIWVFSFGTWDIWTLAALPREVAQGLIDSMVEQLFTQIELLYKASLSVDSPAYSDFWAYTNTTLLGGLNENPAAEAIESFRVVIPELFDISLTPGWHAQRPSPPAPHNKAEHMVNAAFLVDHWNSEVSGRMDEWTRLPDPQPADTDAVPKQPADAEGKPYFGFWNPSEKAPSEGGASDDTLLVPYPRRAGLLANATSFVKEVIIESQLRASGVGDGLGRGKREDEDVPRFDEVWVPCIWDGTASKPCEHPEKHLFYSPFTLGEKAIREAARQMAEAVATLLFARDSHDVAVGSGWRVSGAAKEKRGSESSFRVEVRPTRM
ncbi:hypothetical protein ACHAQH_007378 [Verticillium albo-atrum]